MSDVKQKRNTTNELGRKTYAEGNLIWTVLKISFPVFILMLVNSLYQIIDALLAAQLVEFTVDGVEGALNGAYVSTLISPVFAIAMAVVALTNFGFGAVYSQKLGQGDELGAKKAISSLYFTTIVTSVLALLLVMAIMDPMLKGMMGVNYYSDDYQVVVNDARQSALVYMIAICISAYQGNISRELRAEGHIKSMSYLPLLSIPVNIGFDILFMGVMDMNVAGAGLATLIAMGVSLIATFLYLMVAKKQGKTHFSWSVFNEGIDWKIVWLMIGIGIVPFAMQLFRAYNQVLVVFAVSKLSHHTNNLNWIVLYSAATRPGMLVMMPAVAVMQAGGSFLAFNYGAGNKKRLNQGVLVMGGVMFLYSSLQYVLLMAYPNQVMHAFGVNDNIDWEHMIYAYRLLIGCSIFTMLFGLTTVYYMSTRRPKIAFAVTAWNLLVNYTLAIVICFFLFATKETGYWNFFLFYPLFVGVSLFIALTTFFIVRYKDMKTIDHKIEVEKVVE